MAKVSQVMGQGESAQSAGVGERSGEGRTEGSVQRPWRGGLPEAPLELFDLTLQLSHLLGAFVHLQRHAL